MLSLFLNDMGRLTPQPARALRMLCAIDLLAGCRVIETLAIQSSKGVVARLRPR
jgi:hypothetical protein